jgi:hypothetical protein
MGGAASMKPQELTVNNSGHYRNKKSHNEKSSALVEICEEGGMVLD